LRDSGRTAFLDRDGTINVKARITVRDVAGGFHFLPGAEGGDPAAWGCRLAGGGGDQPARHRSRPHDGEAVDRIHRVLMELPVAAVRLPARGGNVRRRKPGTGLFLHAKHDFPEIDSPDRCDRRRASDSPPAGARLPHDPGRRGALPSCWTPPHACR
jgi:hypothetical protein